MSNGNDADDRRRQRGRGGRNRRGNERAGQSGRGRSRRTRRNRRRRPQQTPSDGAAFWGDTSMLPTLPNDIRMTAEASAVPRSLGPPPLPGHEAVAGHYFNAVYQRAVTTAGALAAAGGLIDPEALLGDVDDRQGG